MITKIITREITLVYQCYYCKYNALDKIEAKNINCKNVFMIWDKEIIIGRCQIMTDDRFLIKYTNTGNVLQDMRKIIEVSRDSAYQAVNFALVRRNWLLGRRIAEEELNGESRAEYGLEIVKKRSKELTDEYGKGFTKTNLYNFYLLNFPS